MIVYLIDSVQELLSFKGVSCGPKMKFVEDIEIKLYCHFEHEFLISVLSYITTILAFLILILYVFSIVSLVYYVYKFFKQKSRDDVLDLEIISYKKLD